MENCNTRSTNLTVHYLAQLGLSLKRTFDSRRPVRVEPRRSKVPPTRSASSRKCRRGVRDYAQTLCSAPRCRPEWLLESGRADSPRIAFTLKALVPVREQVLTNRGSRQAAGRSAGPRYGLDGAPRSIGPRHAWCEWMQRRPGQKRVPGPRGRR